MKKQKNQQTRRAMNISNEIKMGGHNVEVKKVGGKDIRNPGEYDSYYDLIRLLVDDNPESSIAEAFLHEIIERIVYKNNLVIDHVHLTVLSENLFQVLRDNKLDFTE